MNPRRICRGCGVLFDPDQHDHYYCGKECEFPEGLGPPEQAFEQVPEGWSGQEPTPIIKNGGEPYRNFTFNVERARRRAAFAFSHRYEDKIPWKDVEGDALMLAVMVQTLVEENRILNKLLPLEKRRELCPCCGGDTWGRPQSQGEPNYKLRRCSVCEWVRPEPEPEPAPAEFPHGPTLLENSSSPTTHNTSSKSLLASTSTGKTEKS